MLKNIREHLDNSEEKQSELDALLAQTILKIQPKNSISFQQHIPALADIVRKPSLSNISLFANKNGEFNMVDYGSGQVFYGIAPAKEVHAQVDQFSQNAIRVDLKPAANEHIEIVDTPDNYTFLENCNGLARRKNYSPAPNDIECLVVLGCGLGFHLLEILERFHVHNLIVYEPEVQYFQCSTMITEWNKIFSCAKDKQTKIFMQIGEDGRNLVNDIKELLQIEPLSSFLVYKHYNNPVFDSIEERLKTESWQKLSDYGLSLNIDRHFLETVEPWTPIISIDEYRGCQKDSPTFQRNLDAFKKFFPDIYEEFVDFNPQVWIPVMGKTQEVNVVHKNSLTPWYSESPKQDCFSQYENYSKHPNKDGLILGYDGEKLAHYMHYQFVRETENIFAETENELGELPERIASIILFGIGIGYHLERLIETHDVEKIFICEPNRDFFFASMFAIDWAQILEKMDEQEASVYINIGDDGSHLFEDLLRQFHSIGPYILNNTYFYQSYYNASLNQSISLLREQLQIVISMGEYFDHAYYGIAHTRASIRKNTGFLGKSPAQKLSELSKETPVFIVGNGPSLDFLLPAIKENSENAIIVSCGTALQSLYKNGITPDFHAEIEQNRSTYDWAVNTGSLDFLKQITLISCNGIHPDTSELYKETLLAFKEGESSTVASLKLLGEKNYELLQHAFPTVSNFATNLFATLGFFNIYFAGVDLGFIEAKKHHSIQSGYYLENGEETYNYAERNNTSIVVEGNFRHSVFTKYEFKVAKQVIEQIIAAKIPGQAFYNLSDGAKINGAEPLSVESLLVVSTNEEKAATLSEIKSKSFIYANGRDFERSFEGTFNRDVLVKQLDELHAILERTPANDDIENSIIHAQKQLLFDSFQEGNSLLFYYLYGTSNYANALLTKLLYSGTKISFESGHFNQALALWRSLVKKVQALVSADVEVYDTSSFRNHQRERFLLNQSSKGKNVLIVTDKDDFIEASLWLVKNYFELDVSVDTCRPADVRSFDGSPEFVIYNVPSDVSDDADNHPLRGEISTILITYADQLGCVLERATNDIVLLPFKLDTNNEHWLSDQVSVAALALNIAFQNIKNGLVVPKYKVNGEAGRAELLNRPLEIPTNHILFDYPLFSLAVSRDTAVDAALLANGTRGTLLSPSEVKQNQIQIILDEGDFVKTKQKFESVLLENVHE